MTVKEEPQFAAETFEEKKTRVLAARIGLTTTWVLSVDHLKLGVDSDEFYFFFWPLCLLSTGLFVFLWFSLVVINEVIYMRTSGEEIY